MKFSELSGVTVKSDDDWFDPVLSLDTRLFLDPFLLYASETGHFVESHSEIIAFFNSVFKLIARAQGNRRSTLWKKAVNSLLFGEVEEICLGYAQAGTKGSGSGRELARVFAEALWEAIQAGITEITHFEEICILRGGIGADRISDMTAGLLRHRLATYTEEICERHHIPITAVRYARGMYNIEAERWVPIHAKLPRNPYNGKPILLVPRRYLRELPTINADDFWDYCYSYENETLRNEFSYDVTRRVAKREIIAFARRHPEERARYLIYKERLTPRSYDFVSDPKGLIQWYDATSKHCQHNPISLCIQSEQDFREAVAELVNEFKHYVEENRGWNLLWNENLTPRKESAAQDLFLGIVKHYCRANDIDISREADIGRGPVDFKTSHGFRLRVLLEVKLAKNTRFWNGLEKQLPKYQDAEGVGMGYFLVIAYTDKDFKRLSSIRQRVRQVSARTGYDIRAVVVDSRRNPVSASKL